MLDTNPAPNRGVTQPDYTLAVPIAPSLSLTTIDALRRVMDPHGRTDLEDDTWGLLRLHVTESPHGTALERCEDAAAALAAAGEARPVKVWSTPCGAPGALACHVPGLGVFTADCDSEGEIFLNTAEITHLLDREPATHLPAGLHTALGTAWTYAFEAAVTPTTARWRGRYVIPRHHDRPGGWSLPHRDPQGAAHEHA